MKKLLRVLTGWSPLTTALALAPWSSIVSAGSAQGGLLRRRLFQPPHEAGVRAGSPTREN